MTEANIDEVAVITVRIIDMAPPSDDTEKRLCSVCGEMTWLSKHWKGKRIDKIICEKCFYDSEEYKKKEINPKVTEECVESAIKKIRMLYNLKDTDDEIRERLMIEFEKKIGKKIEIVKIE